MRGLSILPRTLVFVGALILLVSHPRGAQDAVAPDVGACNNVESTNIPCPSGCTSSSFYGYVTQLGNGVYELVPLGLAPCGQAKSGETCSPPEQYGDNYIFLQCCAGMGLDCTGVGYEYMNCCDPSPVVCMKKCCVADGGSCTPGQEPIDCCSGLCLYYSRKCGTCSDLTGECLNASDCCYYDGISCPSGKCCLAIGKLCSGDSDCCSGHCANKEGQCICVS